MTEIVAIDIGASRVGVAIGNDEIKIAHPFAVWDYKEAEKKLLELIKNRSILILVIGLALNDDNSESKMSIKSRNFAKRIGKRTSVKTIFVDEYGSSLDSEELLIDAGSSKSTANDSHAAAVILNRYFATVS